MGGAGLPFGLILIAAVVILVLIGVYVVVPFVRGESRLRDRLTEPGHGSLVYEVPEGQDPAAILAALRQDGLDAIEVMRQGRQRIVISCSPGPGRLRPRAGAAIARVVGAEVTFVDE